LVAGVLAAASPREGGDVSAKAAGIGGVLPAEHPARQIKSSRGGPAAAGIPAPRDVASSVEPRERPELQIPPSRKVVPPPRTLAEANNGVMEKIPARQDNKKGHTKPLPGGGRHTQQTGHVRQGAGGVPSRAAGDDRVVSQSPVWVAGNAYTEAALMSLLGHLVDSYQQGDLASFVGLFSATAATTDETSRAEIEAGYRALFATTQVRRLQVSRLEWRTDNDGAHGEGYMVLQLWRDGGGAGNRYEGRFSVDITREQQRLLIGGLFYDLVGM